MRSFSYSSLSRLTSASNPENGTVTFDYDNNGNLLHKTDARSITTTFAYDALNRITSKSFNDTPQTPPVSYFYDSQSLPAGAPTFTRGYAAGRLVAVTFGSGSSAGTYCGYDALGRVLRQYQQTDFVNYLVEATYYANGSIQNEIYPSVPGFGDRRVVSYVNDSAGRLGSVSSSATSYSSGASVSSIGYSPHRAITTETYGNNLIHGASFNSRLQPSEIKLGTSGAPTSVIDLNYNYGTSNNNGNVLSLTYSGGGLSYSQTFSYDSLNRLATAQENGGSSWSQTNSYDVYGNRAIAGSGITFNSNNRMNGYSYDSAGNLLNDGSHGYTYDGENKIAKVDGVAAYVYDGEGQRVRKLLAENLRFIYGIGGHLIAEFNGVNGTLSKEYIYSSSGLVATIEPGANGTRYVTSDYLGSPRVVTNSSAGVVSRHDFKPFGESLGSGIGGRTTGAGFGVADGLREQFTSKERDSETGLDYFASRYFACSHGRFTSADSLVGSPMNPQTLNRYSYVGNNPTNLVDPTGHVRLDPPSKGDQGGYWSETPYADSIAWQDVNAITNAAEEAAANASDPESSSDPAPETISESQEPVTDNQSVIDNSGSADQSCSIQISFSGSYDGLLNGPSVPNSPAGPVYGIGFSVRISGLSGNVAMRSTEKDPKPKGTWLIEQWVADFNFQNGAVVRHDTAARMDNFAVANPRPRRDAGTVSWWDHPGTQAAGVRGYFTKRNFYIKAYNGERHCEAAFHLTFRVFNGQMTNVGWGNGNYK